MPTWAPDGIAPDGEAGADVEGEAMPVPPLVVAPPAGDRRIPLGLDTLETPCAVTGSVPAAELIVGDAWLRLERQVQEWDALDCLG